MAVAEEPTTWLEDISAEIGKFDPVLLDCVSAELGHLASGNGRKSKAATVALQMARDFEHRSCGEARTDDEIVSAALNAKAMVATTDETLAKTLSKLRVRVIGLRSGRAWVK